MWKKGTKQQQQQTRKEDGNGEEPGMWVEQGKRMGLLAYCAVCSAMYSNIVKPRSTSVSVSSTWLGLKLIKSRCTYSLVYFPCTSSPEKSYEFFFYCITMHIHL